MSEYEVVIVGGGPAGLTAGLYASRAGLKTLLLESGLFGGQMVNARLVENYPGFPDGISGSELGSLMHRQATKYGLEIVIDEVTDITVGKSHHILTNDENFESEAVIITAGSKYRKLGVIDEEKFLGRGVSYCATCDGFFFRGRDVAVVGGSDTAISDALELSHHANKIYVIHRRDQLRAGQLLQQRAFAEPKIEFIWDSVVEEIVGDQLVSSLRLRNVKTNQLSTLEVAGIFVAVGLQPNSQYFVGIVELDGTGHIITDTMMATSVPGIFAAGDIRSNSARQIAAAVGDGVIAATSAFKYLKS